MPGKLHIAVFRASLIFLSMFVFIRVFKRQCVCGDVFIRDLNLIFMVDLVHDAETVFYCGVILTVS